MRSRIYAEDTVSNNSRAFGSGKFYYVAELVFSDREPFAGGPEALLFTEHDIDQAAARARANPEDVRHARDEAKTRGRVELAQKAVVLALAAAVVFLAGVNYALSLGG